MWIYFACYVFNIMNNKNYKYLLLTFSVVLIWFQSAWEGCYAAVTLTELQPLKYPTAVQNSGAATVVQVNSDGTLGTATNAILLDADYYQGQYLVTSNSNRKMTLDLIFPAAEPGITLEAPVIRYANKSYNSFPVYGLRNPGKQGLVIEIGSKIVAAAGTSPGLKQPQYTIRLLEE